jgi:3-hydroxyisobutyrate dehydrogenase-like beta-hydroxyacid dehydrogenase
MNQRTTGLIGLGLVGSALVERFQLAGFAVVGFDVASDRRAWLDSAGGTAVASAVEVASECDRIVLSLPTSEVVAAVLDQIATSLRVGSTIIDTTTGSPEAAVAGKRQAVVSNDDSATAIRPGVNFPTNQVNETAASRSGTGRSSTR